MHLRSTTKPSNNQASKLIVPLPPFVEERYLSVQHLFVNKREGKVMSEIEKLEVSNLLHALFVGLTGVGLHLPVSLACFEQAIKLLPAAGRSVSAYRCFSIPGSLPEKTQRWAVWPAGSGWWRAETASTTHLRRELVMETEVYRCLYAGKMSIYTDKHVVPCIWNTGPHLLKAVVGEGVD